MRVLSESYLMNTNMTGFRCFSKIFACVCALDESSPSMKRVMECMPVVILVVSFTATKGGGFYIVSGLQEVSQNTPFQACH